MDLSNHVRAYPLEKGCPYRERKIAVHPEHFDQVFDSVCVACGKVHEFEQRDE